MLKWIFFKITFVISVSLCLAIPNVFSAKNDSDSFEKAFQYLLQHIDDLISENGQPSVDQFRIWADRLASLAALKLQNFDPPIPHRLILVEGRPVVEILFEEGPHEIDNPKYLNLRYLTEEKRVQKIVYDPLLLLVHSSLAFDIGRWEPNYPGVLFLGHHSIEFANTYYEPFTQMQKAWYFSRSSDEKFQGTRERYPSTFMILEPLDDFLSLWYFNLDKLGARFNVRDYLGKRDPWHQVELSPSLLRRGGHRYFLNGYGFLRTLTLYQREKGMSLPDAIRLLSTLLETGTLENDQSVGIGFQSNFSSGAHYLVHLGRVRRYSSQSPLPERLQSVSRTYSNSYFEVLKKNGFPSHTIEALRRAHRLTEGRKRVYFYSDGFTRSIRDSHVEFLDTPFSKSGSTTFDMRMAISAVLSKSTKEPLQVEILHGEKLRERGVILRDSPDTVIAEMGGLFSNGEIPKRVHKDLIELLIASLSGDERPAEFLYIEVDGDMASHYRDEYGFEGVCDFQAAVYSPEPKQVSIMRIDLKTYHATNRLRKKDIIPEFCGFTLEKQPSVEDWMRRGRAWEERQEALDRWVTHIVDQLARKK